jgi:arylsulfatase A-like enzyme
MPMPMPTRRLGRFLGVLLGLAVGCAEPQPAGPAQDVLLVTFDTTRADRLGPWGGSAMTPVIDRLARRGVLFERAIAPAPITLPSHVSILTGLAPRAHGVWDNAIFVLDPEARLVSEVFSEFGFRTGAFVGSFVLSPRFGLDQGFEIYRAPPPPQTGVAGISELPAGAVVDAALTWIGGLGEGERFFAWVHFMDPHFPYRPPDAFAGASHPYDGEIGYADAELGRLLASVASVRPGRRLLVAVTADHGEGLGDHGEETHGFFLYQSTLHVPLLLAGPPLEGAGGTRVPAEVSLLQLPSTLLALAGLPPGALGTSDMLPLFDSRGLGPQIERRPILVETRLPYYSFRWRALRGVVFDGHKLVEGAAPELYDLRTDPGETVNLAERNPERRTNLALRLSSLVGGERLGLGRARSLEPGEADLLAALGYVAGSAGDDPFSDLLPDPHDRIGDLRVQALAQNLLTRAERPGAARRGKRDELLDRAEEAYRELEAGNAHDPHVPVGLGVIAHARSDHAAAIPWLEEAVRLRPLDTGLRQRLAGSYRAVGRRSDAELLLAPPDAP